MRRRSRGPSKLRPKEWFGFTTADPATGSPAAKITITTPGVYANYLMSPDDVTAFYDEPTILRMILRFNVVPSQSPANGQTDFLSWGLIVTDIEASGGTLPAGLIPFVPLPFNDADSPWLYQWFAAYPSSTTLWLSNYATLNGSGQEDIRTRRRIPNGFGIMLVATYESSLAAKSVYWTFHGRILVANH